MDTTKKINSGKVKLTSDNISKGIVREQIKCMLKDQTVLDDNQLLASRRKIIPDNGIGEPIYIFAYGSLLWNPTFNYQEQLPARIYGFHRRFCMKTKLGRGSSKNPGLMLALDRGGNCKGSVYKLNKKTEIYEIDLLFKREMITGAYIPKLIKTEIGSGQWVKSLAFTVDKKNKNYIAKITLEETAKLISNANGFLGTCEEYLNFTLASLKELNIKDKQMNKIYNLIKKN